MKKKLIALMLMLVMVLTFGLTACGDPEETGDTWTVAIDNAPAHSLAFEATHDDLTATLKKNGTAYTAATEESIAYVWLKTGGTSTATIDADGALTVGSAGTLIAKVVATLEDGEGEELATANASCTITWLAEGVEVLDFEAYDAAVALINSKTATGYTSASWTLFLAAKAEIALNYTEATADLTQELIDAAVTAIGEAIALLVEDSGPVAPTSLVITADKTDLYVGETATLTIKDDLNNTIATPTLLAIYATAASATAVSNSVATISNGVVTAVGVGNVWVYATYQIPEGALIVATAKLRINIGYKAGVFSGTGVVCYPVEQTAPSMNGGSNGRVTKNPKLDVYVDATGHIVGLDLKPAYNLISDLAGTTTGGNGSYDASYTVGVAAMVKNLFDSIIAANTGAGLEYDDFFGAEAPFGTVVTSAASGNSTGLVVTALQAAFGSSYTAPNVRGTCGNFIIQIKAALTNWKTAQPIEP
jgi:hypothetical protein